jgi:hypothetical protein
VALVQDTYEINSRGRLFVENNVRAHENRVNTWLEITSLPTEFGLIEKSVTNGVYVSKVFVGEFGRPFLGAEKPNRNQIFRGISGAK